MKETPVTKRILLACSRGSVRLWRNNCGQWKDKAGNWIRYGLSNPGGSDLIGFKTITVTPEMVGTELAVFVAIEVKRTSSADDATTDDQQKFIDNVKSKGGIAGVARTVKEAKAVLTI